MKHKSNNKKPMVSTNNSASYANYFNRVTGLNGNAARISFYNPVGLSVGTDFFGEVSTLIDRVPGIIRIGFVPGVGYASSNADAVNVASKGILAYLTSNIGRPYSYDPQDLMEMIFSYECCVLHLVKLSRVIGIAQLVSGENRYIPEDLIRAAGFDPVIKNDLPKARWLFNYYANQLNKINVPDVFSSFKWHIKLLSKVIRDSDNLKAQLYVLDSDVYYIYDEVEGQCRANKYSGVMTLSNWETIMTNMLNALVNSQTVGNMSSDIKKAFDNMIQLPRIEENYITPIDKDDQLLSLIHNLTLVGPVLTGSSGDGIKIESLNLTQDPQNSNLLWKPEFNVTGDPDVNRLKSGIKVTKVLDMSMDNPSEDDVLLATRGKINLVEAGNGKFAMCGTELYTIATIYIHTTTSSPSTYEYYTWKIFSDPSMLMSTITLIEVFDWSPRVMFQYRMTVGSQARDFPVTLGEIRNYTVVNDDILKRITDGALASIYNIPEIGILK